MQRFHVKLDPLWLMKRSSLRWALWFRAQQVQLSQVGLMVQGPASAAFSGGPYGSGPSKCSFLRWG
jgi:hypothetical protein